MKKAFFIVTILLISITVFSQNVIPSYRSYIKKYHKLAIEEKNEYNIPASITLAQALIESGAGNSPLAVKAKNHFGIKCGKSWYGKTFTMDDDTKDECFRVYNTVKESYEDHSKFLMQPRYSFLFDYPVTDYKSWAKGLRMAGYATDLNYPSKLISLIETYQLYKYDNEDYTENKDNDIYNKEVQENSDKLFEYEVIKNNGVKCVKVFNKDDSIQNIAKYFKVPLKFLLFYNDMYKPMPLYRGDYVYLHPKRLKNRVDASTYTIKNGDSMHSVSQMFGIRLKSLYRLNKLQYGTEAKVGMVLKLR